MENLTPEQCQAALKEAWTGAFPRVIVTSNKENSQGSAEIMKAYRESQTAKVQPYQADGRKDFSYKFGDPGKVTAVRKPPTWESPSSPCPTACAST